MELDDLDQIQTSVRSTYDQVAVDYVLQLSDELDQKPFDRVMLDWLAERVGDRGVICDLGCGPGHIARYLAGRGASVCGIDLSPGMVHQAKLLNPAIEFAIGDMLDLNNIEEGSWAGIAALYSIVNLPIDRLASAFREMFRTLMPAGIVLVTFHIGTDKHHLDEWWDHKVAIDFYFHETERIKQLLLSSGFALSEVVERDPYPEVEYPSRRAYVFARKPG